MATNKPRRRPNRGILFAGAVAFLLMPARRSLLAAALATLALAGCGGGGPLSKDDYNKKIDAAGQALARSFAGLGPALSNAQDQTKLSEKLSAAGEALREQGTKLGTLEPPEDIAQANRQLADGLTKMGDSYDQVAKSIQSGTISQALPKLQAITTSEGLDLVRKALTTIKAKGYKVSTPGS